MARPVSGEWWSTPHEYTTSNVSSGNGSASASATRRFDVRALELESRPGELDASLGEVDTRKFGAGAGEPGMVGAEPHADLEHGLPLCRVERRVIFDEGLELVAPAFDLLVILTRPLGGRRIRRSAWRSAPEGADLALDVGDPHVVSEDPLMQERREFFGRGRTTCSRTLRARAQPDPARPRIPGSARSRPIALAAAGTSPGGTSRAVWPSVSTSTDLPQARRHDRLSKPHVLEQLRRRAKERRPIRIREMRRNADVATRKQLERARYARAHPSKLRGRTLRER